MASDSEPPTPPEGLPDRLVSDLRELSDEELRMAIIHAQELLQAHGEHPSGIEPGPGEDIIRVSEHEEEGYTEVVKTVNCVEGCDNCPHGPYLYHVTEEPRPEGETKTHWSFIGKVEE
ncbi:MAG: hypothetical protein ACOCY1_03110 [Halovenus sp.]